MLLRWKKYERAGWRWRDVQRRGGFPLPQCFHWFGGKIVTVCLFLITKRRSETVKCKITRIVALKWPTGRKRPVYVPLPAARHSFSFSVWLQVDNPSLTRCLSLCCQHLSLLPALLVKLWLLLLYARSLPLHTSLGICYLSNDSPYFSIRYFSQKL